MKYSVDKRTDLTVFKLMEENLNTLVAPKLKSEIIILNNEGVKNLILDLSETKYVDSSGLSAILTANRITNKIGGTFMLTGTENPTVKKLISISRIDSVINIVPTVQEAIDYIMLERLEREIRGGDEEE